MFAATSIGALLGALVAILAGATASSEPSAVGRSSTPSPVADTSREASLPETVQQAMALPQNELEELDIVRLNLLVAKSIEGLEDLDIARYERQVAAWADQLSNAMPVFWQEYDDDPAYWDHDPDTFKLGALTTLMGRSLGIRYIDDEPDYRQSGGLFVHTVIDERRGTCVSMPVLLVGLGRRLGHPLKLVVGKDHVWARWDDGHKQVNVEATDINNGKFSTGSNAEYAQDLGIEQRRIDLGSDMKSLTSRQALGVFLQIRGDHRRAKGDLLGAQPDFMLAHALFPANIDIFNRVLLTAEARGRSLYGPLLWERAKAHWIPAPPAHPGMLAGAPLWREGTPNLRQQTLPGHLGVTALNEANRRRSEEVFGPSGLPFKPRGPGIPSGIP